MSASSYKPEDRTLSCSEALILCLITGGILLGCLILAAVVQLITWSDILSIIQVTLVGALLGMLLGILAKCFIGRRKSFGLNLMGMLLVFAVAMLVAFLPKEWTIAVYSDNASQMGGGTRALGIIIGIFVLGAAFKLGGSLTQRVQNAQQRKHPAQQSFDD